MENLRCVKGIHVRRAWNDFATAGRTGDSPSYLFFIDVDTPRKKDGGLKFVLDKGLTEKYNNETKN